MHADPDRSAAHVQGYRDSLEGLMREGRRLQSAGSARIEGEVRVWQRDCAGLIGQLSGGSKAHWLSRAYSEAFLVSPAPASADQGAVATDVSVGEILARIVSVLELAAGSLARLSGPAVPTANTTESSSRFAFLADLGLRAGVVEADAEAEAALGRGDFGLALVTTCSVLESVITDALERVGDPSDPVPLHDRSFDQRIAAAERLGVTSAGCRRLPEVARGYRALLTDEGDLRADAEVSEREATRTRQVLRVIVRDLAPGR